MIHSFPYTPDCLALSTWVSAEDGDAEALSMLASEAQSKQQAAAAQPGAAAARSPQAVPPVAAAAVTAGLPAGVPPAAMFALPDQQGERGSAALCCLCVMFLWAGLGWAAHPVWGLDVRSENRVGASPPVCPIPMPWQRHVLTAAAASPLLVAAMFANPAAAMFAAGQMPLLPNGQALIGNVAVSAAHLMPFGPGAPALMQLPAGSFSSAGAQGRAGQAQRARGSCRARQHWRAHRLPCCARTELTPTSGPVACRLPAAAAALRR